MLLFLPVGVAGALAFRRGRTAVALGGTLSVCVEVGQLFVPGRYPSVWDVGFNTAGTVLGVLLVGAGPLLLRPPPSLRRALALGSLGGALAVLAGGAALFAPAGIRPPLRAEWTPLSRTGHAYAGTVTAARLGGEPLEPGVMRDAPPPMTRIRAGDTLRIAFVAGAPPVDWVPLLRGLDAGGEAALTVGIRGHDVAFSYRTLAAALHLDQPELRLAGALSGVRPGDSVEVIASARGDADCIHVRTRHACLSPSAGDTWALLLYPVPRALGRFLPYLWIALLLVPGGFWVDRTRHAAALTALVVCAFALMPQLGLAPVPPAQLLAAPLGLGAGHWLGRQARRRPSNPIPIPIPS